MLDRKRLKKLQTELFDVLNMGPNEDDCTEAQNTMYSDIANLTDSIESVLEELDALESFVDEDNTR